MGLAVLYFAGVSISVVVVDLTIAAMATSLGGPGAKSSFVLGRHDQCLHRRRP